MNAKYKKIEVQVQLNGQFRTCYLHVVAPKGGPEIYFLMDYYGWPVADQNVINAAIYAAIYAATRV